MSVEVQTALVASLISLIGILFSLLLSHYRVKLELRAHEVEWKAELASEEERWKNGFRSELHRDLTREASLVVIQARLASYGEVWKSLGVTSNHHIKTSTNLTKDFEDLVETLNNFAYGPIGMVMSERSRELLNHLRSGCGGFLENRFTSGEVRYRAHLLKHSMRGDINIADLHYAKEVDELMKTLISNTQ